MNIWKAAGFAYKATSVDDAITAIARLTTLDSSRKYVWRGQANANWKLDPSIARGHRANRCFTPEALDRVESDLINEARKWPAPEFAGLPTDQNVLANLQHHGVPTTLLDVTTDPYTALWFACSSSRPDERRVSGVILGIDVTNWARLHTEVITSGSATWAEAVDPLGHDFKSLRASSKPFLIEPSRPTGRMLAQRGLLLRAPILGKYKGPHGIQIPEVTGCKAKHNPESVLKPPKGQSRPHRLPLVAFIIGTQMKKQLERHLEGTLGLGPHRLFPDLSGFANNVGDIDKRITQHCSK